MTAEEDFELLKYGIGFTNMVQRATKGSAELTRKEIKEGSRILLEKLQRFRPKIAVFNGKLIFEVFSGKKDFHFGRQPEFAEGTDTYLWVMPSSSARCAQLPRASDKVPFYMALKTFRDYLNGLIPHIDESELVFAEIKYKKTYVEMNMSDGTAENTNKSGRTESCGPTISPETATKVSDIGIDCNKNQIEDYAKICTLNGKHSRFVALSAEASCMYKQDQDTTQSTVQQSEKNLSMTPTYHKLAPLVKKKRGRPKKIKNHDLLVPAICKPIQIINKIPCTNNFGNILALSNLGGDISSGFGTAEAPKKKRGRPKKLKTFTEFQKDKSLLMPTTSLAEIDKNSEQYILKYPKERYATYGSEEINQKSQQIYATGSPIRSPSLNCSYAGITPPTSTQSTPPTHRQPCDKLFDACSTKMFTAHTGKSNHGIVESSISTYYENQNISVACTNSTKRSDCFPVSPPFATTATAYENNLTVATTNVEKLGTSSPPNSPNICAVDFELPSDVGALGSKNGLENLNQYQPALLKKPMHPNICLARPVVERSTEATPITAQKWLSPLSETSICASDTHESQRKQADHFSKYSLHTRPLSGLESLVDQIPSFKNREDKRCPDIFQEKISLQEGQHNYLQRVSIINNLTGSENYCASNSRVNGISETSETNYMVNNNNSSDNNPSYPATFAPSTPIDMSSTTDQQQQVTLHQLYGSSVDQSIGCDDGPWYVSRIPDDISNASTNAVPKSCSPHNRAMVASMHYKSNYNQFCVSNFATPSFTLNKSCNSTSDYTSIPNVSSVTAASSVYHHSNFMTAAASAALPSTNNPPISSKPSVPMAAHQAANYAAHTHIYMDPHRHLPTHMGNANTMYTAATPYLIEKHLHSACSTAPGQYTATNDYINPYCTSAFSSETQVNPLHLRNPNYTYVYGNQEAAAAIAAVAHSEYQSAMHLTHHSQSSQMSPLSQQHMAHCTGHSATTNLHQYSQSMFDPLRPPDISGYGGF